MTDNKSIKKQKGNVEATKAIQIEDFEKLIKAFEFRIDYRLSVVEDKISNLKSELLESSKECCVRFVKDQFRNKNKEYLVR